MARAQETPDIQTRSDRPVPPDVVIRPQILDDDPHAVEIGNRLNPEFPQSTVEEYRQLIEKTPPGVKRERFVAERKGEIVGRASIIEMFWTGNPSSFSGGVDVLPDHRGQGIGSALYQPILQSARDFGAERLYARVRDDRDEARRFALHRGYRETGYVMRMSRLDVTKANYEGYDELEERLRDESIRVKTLAELGPQDDAVLRAIHGVEMRASEDEPSSERYAISFEHWRDFSLTEPGVTPEAIFVALHGDMPIGLTTLQREGANGAWHHGLSVEREYRGRGVARLLKLRTIQYALLNGIDFLYTGNDVSNPRMYAINVRLGYQPLPNSIELVKGLST